MSYLHTKLTPFYGALAPCIQQTDPDRMSLDN